MKHNVIIMLCLALTGWSTAHAEDWITEEVLKQLSEIRQELKILQQEVRDLKAQGGTQPAVLPKPSVQESIDISNAPTMGAETAEYAIIEFSDYQCPYCRRHFSETLPAIEENYVATGKVKYVMKQFPLGFHSKAKGASIAALCLEKSKEGSYWAAHTAMFDGSTKLANEDYIELARSLDIDLPEFEECLVDPLIAARVDQDMAEGESVGVSGTPAFYIGKIIDGQVVNGQLLTGARPYSSFSSLLSSLK